MMIVWFDISILFRLIPILIKVGVCQMWQKSRNPANFLNERYYSRFMAENDLIMLVFDLFGFTAQ